jgi:hypothetical protein
MIIQKLRLPELEALWNWPRLVSPYLVEIEQECLEWNASFGAFDPDTQRLLHDKGKLSECLDVSCALLALLLIKDLQTCLQRCAMHECQGVGVLTAVEISAIKMV